MLHQCAFNSGSLKSKEQFTEIRYTRDINSIQPCTAVVNAAFVFVFQTKPPTAKVTTNCSVQNEDDSCTTQFQFEAMFSLHYLPGRRIQIPGHGAEPIFTCGSGFCRCKTVAAHRVTRVKHNSTYNFQAKCLLFKLLLFV